MSSFSRKIFYKEIAIFDFNIIEVVIIAKKSFKSLRKNAISQKTTCSFKCASPFIPSYYRPASNSTAHFPITSTKFLLWISKYNMSL